jgi:uncharacterized membrane protein required for colicin V production
MIIDVFSLGLAVYFFFSGYRRGFLFQVIRIALMLGSWIAARALRPTLVPFITATSPEIPEEFRGLMAFVLLFGIIYLVATFLLSTALRHFHQNSTVAGGLDKLAGGALGVVKIGLVIYAIFCIYLAVAPIFDKDTRSAVENSHVLGYVADNNILHGETSTYLKGLRNLSKVARDRELRERLLDDPEIKSYLKGDGKALMDDEALRQAIEIGDWDSLLTDERIQKIIRNPGFYKALERLQTTRVDMDQEPELKTRGQ